MTKIKLLDLPVKVLTEIGVYSVPQRTECHGSLPLS